MNPFLEQQIPDPTKIIPRTDIDDQEAGYLPEIRN